MKESLVSAVDGVRFRGASTITQQLAKNLYLSREKTLSRKVREAFWTLALEAELPKSRLLEIYLNIIEWGPGIYGIGEAARHYFGVDARNLEPQQAAFLATIIPNPVKYYVYFQRGALSEAWQKRVRELLVKLREHGTLTEEAFMLARASPVVFGGTAGRQ
jgi:membrane peptidoglycan carboxypeptidase